MINRQATALTLTAISILFSSAAFADGTDQKATADMNVKLTVEKSCQISVDDMDFGSHTSDSGAINVFADASVTCTNGTSYNLSSSPDHSYTMKKTDGADGSTDSVAYALYGDSSRTSELSSTSITKVGTGSMQMIPIYGKVTANALAKASAGSYADTVTLTVTY